MACSIYGSTNEIMKEGSGRSLQPLLRAPRRYRCLGRRLDRCSGVQPFRQARTAATVPSNRHWCGAERAQRTSSTVSSACVASVIASIDETPGVSSRVRAASPNQ